MGKTRKTDAAGSEEIKKKTSSAKKGKKSAGKSGHKSSRGWLGLVLAVILAAVAGSTFVPPENVPYPLSSVHTPLVTWRNQCIRRAGLPFSGYEDCYTVVNQGSEPIRVYLAPSPKITPALCSFIRSAARTIDLCTFDLKLNELADALIEANQNGLKIRIVTDSDYLANPALARIISAGIQVVSDHRPTLMHNKFIIVDSRYVWTGSFNMTDNGAKRNDNNAVIIDSVTVANAYQARFEQYWNGNFSTNSKPLEFPHDGHSFVGTMPVTYAFSPADKVMDILMEELDKAQNSVDVMAFSFTDIQLADKLQQLAKRGIPVRCLFDNGQAKQKASKDEYLQKRGVQVFYSPNRKGKMHHKVIVIDKKTVITGSFNYSHNAGNRNDENILILRSARIGEIYTHEMNRCISGVKGY